MLYPVDTPENAQLSWDQWNDKSQDTNKRMSVCDSCVELLSHIVENARRALEARGRQNIFARNPPLKDGNADRLLQTLNENNT